MCRGRLCQADAVTAPARLRSTPHQRRLQRRWYWYDWAASAYVTVTLSVLLGPYLTSVAGAAACPGRPSDQECPVDLHVLGIPVAPGSLVPYTLTVSTIASAFLLLVVGALADRMRRPQVLFAVTAWSGAAFAALMFFVEGDDWRLGVVLAILANLSLSASLVVYSALMIAITPPDDRDHVSSRGFAYGYLGGGLVLVVALVLLGTHDRLGWSTGQVVRIMLGASGVWWAVFAAIPILGLAGVDTTGAGRARRGRDGMLRGSLRQLRGTFGELRGYRQTWRFLVAYLFYNDGMQTVIAAAALYGKFQLGFGDSQLVLTILVVQIVAFVGALGFGRLARVRGAQRTILLGLVLWAGTLAIAFVLPRGEFVPWVGLAVVIGLVLGGTQALSRSLYSHLVPHGRESEFFSLYQAMERGTSWLGTLLFGLVYQLFHDYRLSIVALLVFFVVGGALLRTVRVREGILAVGNTPPAVL